MRGEDPDVEALIASRPDMPSATRDTLRRLAGTFGAGQRTAPVILARDSALPFTELGPYALLARVGAGGMGVVYSAEHRFLKRRVALKVIRPELAFSEVTRQRFQREAMSIAKLRHENIVSVYDAGEHGGVAFLAMEWVEGQGLDEILETAARAGRRMDVTTAVRHARGIALALECAHAAGIIHRDVKPSNVRVTPDGRALLLDFGLSLTEEMASLSSVGHISGTPQYASPEQIEKSSAEIDGRTDVYSLGVTLYECLTGQRPFVGANMTQLFHQILAGDPIEPRKLNEDVGEALNGIVMRALEKRRENRFASAGEMALALETWLQADKRVGPAASRGSSAVKRILAAALVLTLGIASWLGLRRGADGDDAAATASPRAESSAAQPVVLSAARVTTPLFGAASLGFDHRVDTWDRLIGPGTFGADEDGPGGVVTSPAGITLAAHAVPGGSGRVSGHFELIAPQPGQRTAEAGVGLEFSNGRMVALLAVATPDGYDVRVFELLPDGESRWTRGAELGSGPSAWTEDRPVVFELGWNDTDTQFDWRDNAEPVHAESLLLPRRLRENARPSRCVLIVEKGSARFEGLLLEES
jgi:tRNA A-37 threonylcarbamoyl transferase component Bud32